MRRRVRALGAAWALVLLLSTPIPTAHADLPARRLPKPSPPHMSDPEVPNGTWIGPRPVSRAEVSAVRAAVWFFVRVRGGLVR
jgi:hypothetical protein